VKNVSKKDWAEQCVESSGLFHQAKKKEDAQTTGDGGERGRDKPARKTSLIKKGGNPIEPKVE